MQAAASILVTKKQTICNWGCTYKLRFFALLVDGVKDAVVRGSWRQVASKELMLKQCVVWYSDVLFGKKIECKQSIIPHYVSFQIITVSYKLQCKVDIAQNAGKIFFLKKKSTERTLPFQLSGSCWWKCRFRGVCFWFWSCSLTTSFHSISACKTSIQRSNSTRCSWNCTPLVQKDTEIQKKDLTKHARSTEAEVTSYTSRALGSPVSWAGKRFDLRAAHFTWAGSWPIFVRWGPWYCKLE